VTQSIEGMVFRESSAVRGALLPRYARTSKRLSRPADLCTKISDAPANDSPRGSPTHAEALSLDRSQLVGVYKARVCGCDTRAAILDRNGVCAGGDRLATLPDIAAYRGRQAFDLHRNSPNRRETAVSEAGDP